MYLIQGKDPVPVVCRDVLLCNVCLPAEGLCSFEHGPHTSSSYSYSVHLFLIQCCTALASPVLCFYVCSGKVSGFAFSLRTLNYFLPFVILNISPSTGLKLFFSWCLCINSCFLIYSYMCVTVEGPNITRSLLLDSHLRPVLAFMSDPLPYRPQRLSS